MNQAQELNAQQLVALFQANPEGLSLTDLTHEFRLNRAAQKQLNKLLNQLQGIGLIKHQGSEFKWADNNRALIGTIRQSRAKNVRFIPDDENERLRGSIRVDVKETNGAFDGDRVAVYVYRSPMHDRNAKVELILSRGKLRIIGRLHRLRNMAFVESLDEKFSFDIDVEDNSEEEEGKIVVVEITRYPNAHEPAAGRIVERLGIFSDDPGVDIEIIIRKHDLPHVFPEEVLAEAEAIPDEVTEEQCVGRLDLRGITTVTIDGETARDFDDAITLQKLENGNFQLGVHIADVSHYVRQGSALNEEARLRGTSVYFPERAIPMLPEKLSNGICSLNPKVDRLTMSAMMEVDHHGRVVNYQLRESVIRSDERMTYTDVNKVLTETDSEISKKYADFTGFFQSMEQLARILMKMRETRGAIDFNLPEAVFQFNEEGQINSVVKAERNIAHRIIEEFMLLANECVAGHMEKLFVPSIYRIHEAPEPQRIAEFALLASSYGYRFPVEGAKPQDYQKLSRILETKPEGKVLSYAMLRSLQRARYAANNAGHFGLAAPVYTHFTSPIRRYPDLIVHRILRALLSKSETLGDSASIPKQAPRNSFVAIPKIELEAMAEESSLRERAADGAERELEDWRKAALLSRHVGEEFNGVIVNVKEFGFFVELDEMYVEGLVGMSSLTDDYYEYDARRQALIGQRTKRKFQLGDRLKIRIDRVNIDRHLVDFSVPSIKQTRKKTTTKSRPKAHSKRR